MIKIEKKYLSFAELSEKWSISADNIHYLIQENILIPAIAWKGYVRRCTWILSNDGQLFLNAASYESKMLLYGWLYLKLPVPDGNCNYKFSYISNIPNAKCEETQNEDWYRLLDDNDEYAKAYLSREYIEQHAVFMNEVIRNVELFHFGINSDFEQINQNELDTNHILYTTDLLKLQNLAINQFFSPLKIQDAKREEVCDWIKNKGNELNLIVSTNMGDAIFTIIKPSDHNPKIKRVKP